MSGAENAAEARVELSATFAGIDEQFDRLARGQEQVIRMVAELIALKRGKSEAG